MIYLLTTEKTTRTLRGIAIDNGYRNLSCKNRLHCSVDNNSSRKVLYFTPYLSKHATVDELPLAECVRQRVKCYVLQKENNKSHNQFESRTSPTLHGKQGEEITADGHQ